MEKINKAIRSLEREAEDRRLFREPWEVRSAKHARLLAQILKAVQVVVERLEKIDDQLAALDDHIHALKSEQSHLDGRLQTLEAIQRMGPAPPRIIREPAVRTPRKPAKTKPARAPRKSPRSEIVIPPLPQ